MFKKGKDRTKRVRNLVIISAMTAIVLSVSTYAWFVGMRTVNVTSFDVEIKTTDSLMLSLNGTSWTNSITISEETLNDVSYAGHTNRWSQLIPMSTVGDVDLTASRVKLFEKASYTATPGGYRLLASRVKNYELDPDGAPGVIAPEQNGYVAFDLFVRNFSGTQYIETYDPLDEEAIYLTTDSAATVASVGAYDTGLQNSVRVAFAQIGRVIGTSMDGAKITGIECTPLDVDGITPTVVDNVTGICTANRPAQIWEPNDKNHNANAISWYNKSCLKRTALELTEDTSYSSDACSAVADGTAKPTYAIRDEITSAKKVDIYDGLAYNGFEHPEWDTPEKILLYDYPYFTDTMKIKTGTERPTFMTLAPNSVTKIRVYVYIEGQDVDNYDFSSIGKKISVNFGFTKERFNEGDISYDGPDVTNPSIVLTGANPLVLNLNDPFVDPGFTATDNKDGDVSASAVVTSISATSLAASGPTLPTTTAVDTATAGTYYIMYNVADAAGNTANEVTRTVIVRP